MKSRLRWIMLAAVCATPLLFAAACESSPDALVVSSPDAATVPPVPPLPPPTTPDAAPDARQLPGTLLTNGQIDIFGVTIDGYVVYGDNKLQPNSSYRVWYLEVMNLATKQIVDMGVLGVNGGVMISGRVVAMWSSGKGPWGLGTLNVWSAATGQNVLATSSLPGPFAASADGSRVAFFVGGPGGSILAAGTSGTPAPVHVVDNVDLGQSPAWCDPDVRFVGSRLFVSTCHLQQAGTTVRTASDTNQVTLLASGADPDFGVDPSGSKVLVRLLSGVAEVHTVPDNQILPVDTNVTSARLSHDGTSVLYSTTSSELRRAPIVQDAGPEAGATPGSVLADAGAGKIFGLSEDATWVALSSIVPGPPDGGLGPSDLQLASGAAPGPMLPLLGAPTGKFYDFTSAGTHVVFASDLKDKYTAGLHARPTDGGAEQVLSQSATAPYLVPGTTQVVFGDGPHYAGVAWIADLKVVDLAKGGAPTPLVDAVVRNFAVFGGSLIYAEPDQGMYTMVLP